MKLRHIVVLGGLFAGGVIGFHPAHAANQAKPTISEEVSAALLRMGQTLRAEQFSFQARTIRVYSEANGEPLHIFHTMKVIVHRPKSYCVSNREFLPFCGSARCNKGISGGSWRERR